MQSKMNSKMVFHRRREVGTMYIWQKSVCWAEEEDGSTSARDTSALKLQIATTLVLFCHPVFFSRQNTFSEEKSTRHVWPLLKCNNHCICEYLSNFRRDLAFALIMCQKFHKSIPTFQAFWGENINALKSP